MGYLKDTIKGISWMGGLRGATRVISFAKVLILARILVPAEFGLFGIAMLILSFLEIVTETGVNIFLIQENSKVDKFINTAWIVSIIRGVLISFLLVILAPFIARFFKAPEAREIILLIAITPIIRGFINPSVVKFQKELLFAKEFFYRFFMYGIDASIAIFFASKTHSAYSLVYGLFAGALFEMVASYFIAKPLPKIIFNPGELKLVLNRGKWVTAAGFFNYAFENFDDAAVGRILATTSLGIYQMAYKITSLPMTEVSDVIQKVTFPVYIKIEGNKERLKSAFLKSLGMTSLLVFPFGIIFLLYPEPLVRIILGEKWLGALPVIRILSFFGVIRALVETSYPLFLSLKKQKYVSLITLLSLTVLLGLIVPLVKVYGIVGAGIAGLAGSLVAIPATVILLNKAFGK